MFDRFNRRINYLRVSVTDRCNLRCVYCRPEEGLPLSRETTIMSFEEIAEVVRTAVGMGMDKVRLTGGEPLVRRDVLRLVEMLARIDGVRDLSMTTNGTLLAPMARDLKSAGLHRVNISLDTLDAERFRKLTRGGELEAVLSGIYAAIDAGLVPVKLNCVVKASSNEPDARMVAEFASKIGADVRFIRQMDLALGLFWPVDGGTGGICSICNRLRLTCEGKVLPCLFSDLAFDVRELGAEEALRRAVSCKPRTGLYSRLNRFCKVGG